VKGDRSFRSRIAHIEVIAFDAGETFGVEITQRPDAGQFALVFLLAASGDEEDIDLFAGLRLVDAARKLVKLERRRDGPGVSGFLPIEIAAGIADLGKIATFAGKAREIGIAVLIDARPVHERGFVDIEHDRRALHLRRAGRDPFLCPAEHFGDVVVIARAAVIQQPLLEEIDIVGFAEIGRRCRARGIAAQPRIDRCPGLRLRDTDGGEHCRNHDSGSRRVGEGSIGSKRAHGGTSF